MSTNSQPESGIPATKADIERLCADLEEMEERISSRFAAIERRLEELEWHLDEALSHIKSDSGPS